MNSVKFTTWTEHCQDEAVTPRAAAKPGQRPYHRGNVRPALIEAAVALAREGGPGAVGLREVGRRVGVSPTALYHYFAGLPEILDAVAAEGQRALASAQQAELDLVASTGEPAADAVAELLSVGRGYIRFAIIEPGLFAAAFPPDLVPKHLHTAPPPKPPPLPEESPTGPLEMLERALDGLVATDQLTPADRPGARITAWAAVHGLAVLFLGPLAAVPAATRDQLIESHLDLICRGLVTAPARRRGTSA